MIRLVDNFRPQLIIFSGNTDSVFPETLLHIKKNYHTKLILCNGLSPVVYATKTEKIMAKHFDYIFTNDAFHAIDWKMLGAKNATCLPVSAIDPDICKPYLLTTAEKSEFTCDVSFVGSLSPFDQYRDRIQILEQLTNFNLKIWTFNQEAILSNPKLKKHYAGVAANIKMYKICQAAKINLNLHGHTMPSGGNLRTFEILGSNGFEIVDRTNPKWFNIGKEIITFNDITDLKNKIKYFLQNISERQKITKAGYKRTLKDHTFKNRFQKMLTIINCN
jgi:spore maturation protein CgeB